MVTKRSSPPQGKLSRFSMAAIPLAVVAVLQFARSSMLLLSSRPSSTSNITTEVTTNSNYDDVSQTASVAIPSKCKSVEKQLIRKVLHNGQSFMRNTACPDSDAWLLDYLLQEGGKDQEKFIFLNFGCNKGFDSLRVALAVSQRKDIFNKTKWGDALGIQQAGACKQASGEDKPIIGGVPRPVEVHCVEAMPSNFNILQRAVNMTGTDRHGLTLHHYAMTGTPDVESTFFPNSKPGYEHLGLSGCLGVTEESKGCMKVPAITADDFVAKHVSVKLQDFPNGKDRLPYVSIDVEGFDFTIMKAAPKMLQQTDYLEFEFHRQGDWAHQNLADCIEMLESYGLTCYWTGINKLWRITNCWVDTYGKFHQWSNIACVNPKYQSKLYERMEKVFESTLESTLNDVMSAS